MSDGVETRDPEIISRVSGESVTYETEDGEQRQISTGDEIEMHGEHHFRGTVARVWFGGIGRGHHWVEFENVEYDGEERGLDGQTLPLGELARQLKEDGA